MSLPPSSISPDPPIRPSMRRKSSAQNLLSSFKSSSSNSSSSTQLAPLPVPLPPPTAYQYVAATSTTPATTPTPTTMSREWDVQSLQSESMSSTAGAASLAASNGTALQGTSIEMLRELVKKRIITLTYIRSVHEGCVSVSVLSLTYISPHSKMYLYSTRTQTESLVPYYHGDTRGPRSSFHQYCNEDPVCHLGLASACASHKIV